MSRETPANVYAARGVFGRNLETNRVFASWHHRIHNCRGQNPSLAQETMMEHFNGVIGSPAARQGRVRDQARVAQTAHVQAIALGIIVAQQLAGHFAHAIEGVGALDGVLGVGSWGVLGPKTAMELGTKTRAPIWRFWPSVTQQA